MPDTQGLLQAFGEVHDNPILQEQGVTALVCEGLNIR